MHGFSSHTSVVAVVSASFFFLSGLGCSSTSKTPRSSESSKDADNSAKISSNEDGDKKGAGRECRPTKSDNSTRTVESGLGFPVSLCTLIEKYGERMGGIYTVDRVVPYPDEHPDRIIVHLNQEKGWGENPVGDTKISLMPESDPDGKWEAPGASPPDLSVGERIVTFFHRSACASVGRYQIEDQIVFRDTGDGYTNGHIWKSDPVSLSTLKSTILDLYRARQSGDSCPYNVYPSLYDGEQESEPDAG